MKRANIYLVTLYVKPKKGNPTEFDEAVNHVWCGGSKAAFNQVWDWDEYDNKASFTATVKLVAEKVDYPTWQAFRDFRKRNHNATWQTFKQYNNPT